MTFFSFMVRNHKDSKTEEGRLAEIMRMDRERFPRNSSHKLNTWRMLLRDYIKKHSAIYAVSIETFESCWEEYEACEKSRLNKSS